MGHAVSSVASAVSLNVGCRCSPGSSGLNYTVLDERKHELTVSRNIDWHLMKPTYIVFCFFRSTRPVGFEGRISNCREEYQLSYWYVHTTRSG